MNLTDHERCLLEQKRTEPRSFKKSFALLLGVAGLLFFAACSPSALKVYWQSIGKIRGQVLPLALPQGGESLGALTCTQATVQLFALNGDGTKRLPALGQSPVESDGRYLISLLKGPVDLSQAYLLEVAGCNEKLSRPLTEEANQDISYGTALVSWITRTPKAGNFVQANKVEMSQLLNSVLSSSSYNVAYTNLNLPAQSSQFQTLFGAAPPILLDAPPDILSLNAPTSLTEMTTSNFSVVSKHWSGSYVPAFSWKFENETAIDGSNIAITPGKNTQGTRSLVLTYGQKQAAGSSIDLTKPYNQETMILQIANTYPAKVPVMTLVSETMTNDPTVTLQFDGGLGGANCDTFHRVAIIQDSLSAQLTDSNYTTIDCSAGGLLTLNKTLSGQGPHTLYVWVKDSSGNISNVSQMNVPQIINVTLDTVVPVLTVTAPSFPSAQLGTFTMTGTCEPDATHGLATSHGENVVVTETTTLPEQILAQGPCSSTGTFSFSLTPSTGDGVKTLTVGQKDKAQSTAFGQNAATPLTRTLTRDTTPPDTLTLTTVSANQPFSSTIAIEGACTLGGDSLGQVVLTHADLVGSPLSLTCQNVAGAGHYSATLNFISDGEKNLMASQSDLLGNTRTAQLTVTKDSGAPILTLTSPLNNTPFQSAVTLTGVCETGLTVNISGAVTASGPCTGQAFSISINLTGAEGAKALSLNQTDLAGNSTSLPLSLIKDTGVPTVTAGSLTLTDGTSSSTNFLRLNSSATDSLSAVKYICFKYQLAAGPAPVNPIASDSCWQDLTALPFGLPLSTSVSIANHSYRIGFSPGTYSIFVWYKDRAENISSLSNSGTGTLNQDKVTVTFTPASPPALINLVASRSNSSALPPSLADMQVPQNQTLYVKWKATSATGFGPTPIRLTISYDDDSYSDLVLNLNNGINGPCTLSSDYTGCAAIQNGSSLGGTLMSGSPSSSYYRIRVEAQDLNHLTSMATTNAVNTGLYKTLVGNVDIGEGGSALNAMFLSSTWSSLTEPTHLVMTDNGVFYFLMDGKGLFRVDPSDGNLNRILPISAVATDGAFGTATLVAPFRMAVDYQNRILIFDKDKIKRFDPLTDILSTIIGGGASKANGTLATNFQVDDLPTTIDNALYLAHTPLVPLPNGDILFLASYGSGSTTPIYRYQASDQRVYNLGTPSGTGIQNEASADVGTLGFAGFGVVFDAGSQITTLIGDHHFIYTGGTHYLKSKLNVSSLATEPPPSFPFVWAGVYDPMINDRQGNLYTFNRLHSVLYKYRPGTNDFVRILGSGGRGQCADGTAALSCELDLASVFIANDNTIYFASAGKIRYLNPLDQKVYTLYGQGMSSGDDGLGINARLTVSSNMSLYNDSELAFMDHFGRTIRRYKFSTGGIEKLVGSDSAWGKTNMSLDPKLASLPLSTEFGLAPLYDPSGNLYFRTQITPSSSLFGHVLVKWDRDSNIVTKLAGDGNVDYWNNDGQNMNQSHAPYRGFSPIAINGSKILTGLIDHFDYYRYSMLKLFAFAGGAQEHFAGTSNLGTLEPVAGTPIATSDLSGYDRLSAEWNQDLNGWLLAVRKSANIFLAPEGGNYSLFKSIEREVGAFTVVKNASNQQILYYCSSNDWVLYKKNLTLNTASVALPVPAVVYCFPAVKPLYNATRGSLIFMGERNGLRYIGEILETP